MSLFERKKIKEATIFLLEKDNILKVTIFLLISAAFNEHFKKFAKKSSLTLEIIQ